MNQADGWFTAAVRPRDSDGTAREIDELGETEPGQRVLMRPQPDPFNPVTFSAISRLPQHTFLLAMSMDLAMVESFTRRLTWPDNLWLGTKVATGSQARVVLPQLRRTRGPRHRFVTGDPLNAALDLRPYLRFDRAGACFAHQILSCADCRGDVDRPDMGSIEWVIAGAQSTGIREVPDPAWFRDAAAVCHKAGVPFWFSGWGRWQPAAVALPDRVSDRGLFESADAARAAFWAAMMAARQAGARHTVVGSGTPYEVDHGWCSSATVMVLRDEPCPPLLDGAVSRELPPLLVRQ